MFDPMEFEIDEPEKVVYVVGIGPGDVYYLTQEARNVLEHAGTAASPPAPTAKR